MTDIETLIQSVEVCGRRMENRNGRLWLPLPTAELPTELLNKLIKWKSTVLAALDRRREVEVFQWIITPYGPAKVWNYLDENRIGVILKSELEATDGPCRVHFIQRKEVRLVKSYEDFEKGPRKKIESLPSGESGSGVGSSAHSKLPHYEDGVVQEGVFDKWMVLERLDRPGAWKAWFVKTEEEK